MINSPARFGALTLVLLARLGLGYFVLGGHTHPQFINSANAQTVDDPPVSVSSAPEIPSLQNQPVTDGQPPTAGEQKLAEQMVHADGKGRHLAPHGTFYLLSYVSVKTDKGVEGFAPGQEVKFVSADREKQTLVVSNGRAKVEVPVSKLTNDLDMADMAKNADQANQAKIAAYAQQQQEAYRKFERETAEATAKNLEERKKQETEQIKAAAEAQAAQRDTSATQVYSSYGGYYNEGGYGYGSPYSYFINDGTSAVPQQPVTSTGTGNAAGARTAPNKVVSPRAGGGGGGGPVGPATAPQGNTGSGAPAANTGTSVSGSGGGVSAGAARPPK